MKRLAIIVPISIFLIFILLFNAFQTVSNALLILLNFPFALIGCIVAFVRDAHSAKRLRGNWLIALMGQAVLNGVVMVRLLQSSDE